jgi:membrane protein implicated in regulation of membrane protease activity
MDSPEDWRWVWIIATAVFAIGELTTPGSFFMLPFAIGAFVATVLAFLDVNIVVELLVFVCARWRIASTGQSTTPAWARDACWDTPRS